MYRWLSFRKYNQIRLRFCNYSFVPVNSGSVLDLYRRVGSVSPYAIIFPSYRKEALPSPHQPCDYERLPELLLRSRACRNPR